MARKKKEPRLQIEDRRRIYGEYTNFNLEELKEEVDRLLEETGAKEYYLELDYDYESFGDKEYYIYFCTTREETDTEYEARLEIKKIDETRQRERELQQLRMLQEKYKDVN